MKIGDVIGNYKLQPVNLNCDLNHFILFTHHLKALLVITGMVGRKESIESMVKMDFILDLKRMRK